LFSGCAGFVGLAAGQRFALARALDLKIAPLEEKLVKIEQASGGRLGVAVLDTANGARAGHRADEKFPMCSTFKLLAAAAVLKRADEGKEDLARVVPLPKKDFLGHSPATEKHAGSGMTVKDLCAAAVMQSDNTAANLLLASLGGPSGVTAFARSLGDEMTRLDRIEMDLNEALPGDPRDTTTPENMLADLQKLVLGGALSASSRTQLTEWLIQCETGDARLRAGLPKGWKVGDKTGTGPRGTSNDVAIAWPPGRGAVLISVYLTGSTADDDHRNATIASVGAAVGAAILS